MKPKSYTIDIVEHEKSISTTVRPFGDRRKINSHVSTDMSLRSSLSWARREIIMEDLRILEESQKPKLSVVKGGKK